MQAHAEGPPRVRGDTAAALARLSLFLAAPRRLAVWSCCTAGSVARSRDATWLHRASQAFIELKRTIDDFLETLPLVQQLAHPSMRNRHWTALMAVTVAEQPTSI